MPSSQLIDLSKLTPPELLENLEYEQILEQLKSKLSELVPDVSKTLELESEPLTQLLNTFAYHSMLLKGRINDTVKGNLLATATNSDLDHIATRYGVSRLPEESDERFRHRIQQAFHSLNTAGTAESYRYHTFSADSRVKDVHVTSPSPCHVVLTILSHESANGTPSDALLNKLRATFGLKADAADTVSDVLALQKVRPIGDRVEIVPVTVKPYTINARVQLAPGPGKAQVKAQVLANLKDFFAQTSVMGTAIKRSALFATLYSSGVEDVVLAEPSENVIITSHEVPWCENGIAGVIFEGDV
ncbi:baseplate assembly protein [Pseudoalteromonas piscicida]|uniref:baseplate assembly protein n=1 Tax=Pseudoalteromonas piscicida TaxID=43662 RepID=UPI001C94AD35|nr:baseplate J/gp47 family protein [Pseudoalteromonas piscicida]QZO13889.1 baseplate J/gp47 family protein [Pseudoalteromonas piscicida]